MVDSVKMSTFSKLLNAAARGDTKGMAEESKVYFWDNNKKAMSFDKKRYETRLKEYFHYKKGGNFLTKKELRELAERFRDNGFI